MESMHIAWNPCTSKNSSVWNPCMSHGFHALVNIVVYGIHALVKIVVYGFHALVKIVLYGIHARRIGIKSRKCSRLMRFTMNNHKQYANFEFFICIYV